MYLEEYVADRKDTGKVIIYGATIGGKIIYQCLKYLKIEVAFFCDRAKGGTQFCDKDVRDPSVLYNIERDYKIVIAVTRSIDSVCHYLAEIHCDKCYFAKRLILDRCNYDFECEENEKVQVDDFLRKYPIYVDGVCSNQLILPSLEVFITERCTLRCRDCSHLIPRYLSRGAKNYNIYVLIQQIENVLQVVDYIDDLIILGGEPLLHEELPKLLEWGYQNSRIGERTIISNATVVPKDEVFEVMLKTNTRIRLSDYGKYSLALEDIMKECSARQISYFISKEPWTDMGKIYNHYYSKTELINVFKNCPFFFALLLLNGKLFRCPHVAHLNNLGIIDSMAHDCVDFTYALEKQEEVSAKQEELKKYMKINYLEGCLFCNGIQNGVQEIEPAVQGER